MIEILVSKINSDTNTYMTANELLQNYNERKAEIVDRINNNKKFKKRLDRDFFKDELIHYLNKSFESNIDDYVNQNFDDTNRPIFEEELTLLRISSKFRLTSIHKVYYSYKLLGAYTP